MGVGPLKHARHLGVRWGELRALGLIATALGSSGCTTEHVSQAVHPSELPRIAQDYRDGFVRLRDGRSVPVQNLDEAQVELHAPCATWREEITRTRCGDVSVELSELGTDANQLTPSQTEPWAMRGLRVAEYPPNLVKKTVVGAGHAEKHQIQAMIGFLLPKAKVTSADEADALAIAICHANHRGAQSLAAKALAKVGR